MEIVVRGSDSASKNDDNDGIAICWRGVGLEQCEQEDQSIQCKLQTQSYSVNYQSFANGVVDG